MRTKRMAACLIAVVMAFGVFAVVAATAVFTGHSVGIGHTVTHDVSLDSATTLHAPNGTYFDY